MKTLSELKSVAFKDLKENLAPCVKVTAIILIIYLPIIILNICENLKLLEFSWKTFLYKEIYIFLIYSPFSYGYYISLLKLVREKDTNMISQMFRNFANYKRAFFVPLIVFIYTILWSLLLIIPGIIKSLSYSMTYFISKDHPEYTINECIEESRHIMDGYKWKLFVLYLSFIGWILLGALTLGIAYLWIKPYMYITIVHFYEEIKNENQPQQIEEVTEN